MHQCEQIPQVFVFTHFNQSNSSFNSLSHNAFFCSQTSTTYFLWFFTFIVSRSFSSKFDFCLDTSKSLIDDLFFVLLPTSDTLKTSCKTSCQLTNRLFKSTLADHLSPKKQKSALQKMASQISQRRLHSSLFRIITIFRAIYRPRSTQTKQAQISQKQ